MEPPRKKAKLNNGERTKVTLPDEILYKIQEFIPVEQITPATKLIVKLKPFRYVIASNNFNI